MPLPAPTQPVRETVCPACTCSAPQSRATRTPRATAPAPRAVPRDITATRSAALLFLTCQEVPRYEPVQRRAHGFCRDLWQLIPLVEELAGRRPRGDAAAELALAAVREAHRRLNTAERCGLDAEVERVRRLARSVGYLCDHYETLTAGALARPVGN